MCCISTRLNIIVEAPPPDLFPQEYAEQSYLEQNYIDYLSTLPVTTPGKAPRKQIRSRPRPVVVVELAPSYDGAPSFAAWCVESPQHLDADPSTADGSYSDDAPPKELGDTERLKHRPKFAIRIYDTTETAMGERAALLARHVAQLMDERHLKGVRIEVVALPLAADMDAEGRARKCAAHNKAERAARMAMEDPAIAASWYFVANDFRDEDYYGMAGLRKVMWVIHDLRDSWEEVLRKTEGMWSGEVEKLDLDLQSARGHFLMVCYDVDRMWYIDPDDDDPDVDTPRPELFVREHALESLGDTLYGHYEYGLNRFKNHFVAKGVLEAELALAAAEAAGIEVPRPVIIPYVHEEAEWKKDWRKGKPPWAVYQSRWLGDASWIIRREIDSYRSGDNL